MLVIVTGGSTGIGRALLDHAPAGAIRIDVSRRGPADPAVVHLPGDLADPAAWTPVGDALAEHIAAFTGERVTVIHNAGTLEPIGFAGEVDRETYTRQVLLDAAAPQVLGHRLLAALCGHPAVRRELVLISSGAARTAYPGWSAYGAGKAAVDHWVRTVAAEQERRGGVRVLAIAPGVVDTAMQELIRTTEVADFPAVERFRALHDDRALRTPDEVAIGLWRLLDTADADRSLGPVLDLRDHG